MVNDRFNMECYFCEDILVSIFLRLPARSLLRFKCLSRSWNCVFSDPKFIRSHIKTTSCQQNHKDFLLLYRDRHHLPPALSWLRIDACFDGRRGGGLEAQDVEFPFETSDTVLCTAHCVDGILCTFTLHSSSHMVSAVVWNPMTKEHKRFPVTGPVYGGEAFGFGYDSVIGDYKVIHIEYWQNWRNIHSLRLKADGWNAAHDSVPYRFSITFFNQMATAVNGYLYWIAWKQDRARSICGVILCFDLERETLREETSLCGQGIFYEDYQSVLAGDFKRNKFIRGVLSLLGNSLCLARTYDDEYLYLFLMEENEMTKTKSWVKYAQMHTGNTVYPPLYVTRNGDMLANEQGKTGLFIFYREGSSRTKKVAIQGLRLSYESFYVIPYVESLISPFT
ncbi:hypothetical protein SLEP1_g45747 [Rubroshorea leprosula]|uniref:F-box domain-containing protein n=1 Tax=Rubroshorea leprosula TaxID=152421 RepID=A0AAV5LKQ3_9ROSI|nr:hypothetical protein SLEP1_g45747 [Rubroshorea leprosula]